MKLLLLLASLYLVSADKGIHFTCRDKYAGIYENPDADCSVYYFVCRKNRDTDHLKLSCPAGNLFDKTDKQCKPAEQIRGCEVFALRPAPQQSPPQPPAPAPLNNRPARPPPPSKFQPQQQSPPQPPAPQPQRQFVPQPPSNRPARPPPPTDKFQPQQNPPRPQPPQPIPQGPSRYPQPSYRPQPQPPQQNPSAFECFGLEDGDYPKGCSNIYYSCRGNVAMERKCPMDSLKFDSNTGSCLQPEYVVDCGGRPTTPAPFQPNPVVEQDPRCAGKPSGIFEMPSSSYGGSCSHQYLACNNGFASEMSCPGSLKFDVETGECLAAMYISACGGQPTPAPLPPKDEPKAPIDPAYQCTGLPDGDYEHPQQKCSSSYFSCVGGQPEARECPSASLAFDGEQGGCYEQEYVWACGGKPRQEPITTTHAPFVPESEFSCKGLPDGLHDDHYGCSAIFYACSGGVPSKFRCMGELVFDSESKRCIGQNYVKACGGAPTPIPTIVDDVGTPLPPPAIDFNCQGDGEYSQGCSSEWVVCAFGRPYPRACASDALAFDAESKTCLQKEFVKECGGAAPTPPAPQPSYPQPEPVPFDCQNKYDGLYADPSNQCTPYFYTCSSGEAAMIRCPAGLYFDQDEAACLRQEFIVACGGSPTQPPQPHGSYQPQSPPVPPPPAPQPQPPRPSYRPSPAAPQPQRPAPPAFRPQQNPVFVPQPAPRPQYRPQPPPQQNPPQPPSQPGRPPRPPPPTFPKSFQK